MAWIGQVQATLGEPATPSRPWLLRRGPYISGMHFGPQTQEPTLPGLYMDLTRGNLPILHNPLVPLDEPVLWYDLEFDAAAPQVLASSVSLRPLETTEPALLKYAIDAPAGTPGLARIRLPFQPASLILSDSQAPQSVASAWDEPS